jgi:Na+-translocating ferredoxin:NAD+ oxidoreductase RnfG subunit
MKLHWKHPLVLLAIALIAIEVTAIILMPTPPTAAEMEAQGPQIDLTYVPYMLTALTAAFVAFFTHLIALIIFILRGTIKERLDAIILLLLAFLLPIVFFADRM